MLKQERFKEALYEMYRRAYAASEPVGDWDELMKNAETNEQGEKVIPYDDYECEHAVMEQIVEDVFKEYRIRRGLDRKQLSITFWLGCSPKTKIKDE